MIFEFVIQGEKQGFLSNLSAMRTVRVARIVRVARVIRLLRFFCSLRMLLSAIFSTLKSCVWTALLLCAILSMFGIMFTQAVAEHKMSLAPDPVSLQLDIYFGTLPRSIFTLYKSILGGIDWEVAVAPLSDLHWMYVILFILLITFVYLAVMNVVSGLFLQSALDQAQADKEDVIAQQIKESDQHIARFMSLFGEIDTDRDGCITLEEMEAVMHKDRMRGFLQSLDIEFSDAWTFFKLLDVDAGGRVSAQDFVDGCMRIRGNAKSVHIAQMLYETKWLMDCVWELTRFVEDAFEKLPERLTPGQAKAEQTPLRGRPSQVPRLAGGPARITSIVHSMSRLDLCEEETLGNGRSSTDSRISHPPLPSAMPSELE